MQKSKARNFEKGRVAETIAKNYLESIGLAHVESNFSVDQGEIDLIMVDNDTLVFVEVKYKTDDSMGIPEEMISKSKIFQVRRVAEIFIFKNPELKRKYQKYRIDSVCILGEKINYYKNIDG